MTKCSIFKKDLVISGIKISGHTGYDKIGNDIVCSSISTAMILVCNILKKLDENTLVVVNDKTTTIEFQLNSFSNEINIVVLEFKNYLESISFQYPKNVILDYIN